MAEWQTVRFDPNYAEKLDPEIITLCEAFNAAGFVTTSSCCGHGRSWPHVWFEHSSDRRIEKMARFVLRFVLRRAEQSRFAPQFYKDIRLDGCAWMLEIILSNVYRDTPSEVGLREAVFAMGQIEQAIKDWVVYENL